MAAESILSAFFPVIRDKLISPAIKQLGLAFGADDQLNKLKRILDIIQPALVDAEERQSADPSIKNWLSSLKDAAYVAEDVLEDFDYEARRKSLSQVLYYCCFCESIMTRFSLCRRLNDIIKKMEVIAEEFRMFNFQINRVPQISYHRRPQTHSYVDKDTVIGREKDTEYIVSSLINHAESKNKKIMVLPIVAMGGMGKTTLCQLVYRHHRVESHFQLRMWVCDSNADFDVARLVRLIIEPATKKKCEDVNMELLQNQLREIISGKRYLIVLDDVWNESPNQWDRLKMLLDYGGEGSAVVVSTRSKKAAKVMATHTIHYLKTLRDEDSWELFRRRAFALREEEPANLVKIGKDIIKRCGGLPLAIATLGSMMHLEDDEEKWKAVLGNEIWELPDAKHDILPALRLSYNYLPSHLKQCFAFCAIYPKDYMMNKDTMIQMWMANGFIPSDGNGDLDAVGRDIFDELVWRSFFQNVEKPEENIYDYSVILYFKIHDLMHDLAQSIMGKECLNFTDNFNWKDIPSTTKHLSTVSFPDLSSCNPSIFPTLRTITNFNDMYEINLSSKFTSKFKALRVLALSSHKLRVGDLRHLRMLDLSTWLITELPEGICSLYNLQTLNLSGNFSLKKLPDNLTDLVNLRHLYLDGCHNLICMPRGMRRLKKLQTLTKYIVSIESERGIEQLRDMNLGGELHISNIENVSNAFNAEDLSLSTKQNLHSIKLSWRGVGSLEVFEALKPHDKLQILHVQKYKGCQFPEWMNDPQLLKNMVCVRLSYCIKCRELPPLGLLQRLKFLQLYGIYEVKHIISKTIWCNGGLHTTLFPSLKKLSLSMMENLEGWWEPEESNAQGLPDSRQLFPCLTLLSIDNCNKLTTIPSIPSLLALELSFCNSNIIDILFFTSAEWTNHSQLRNLFLYGCNGLVHFSTDLPSICTIEILHCHSLESLSGLGGFVRLQELSLRYCDGLVSLPEGMKSLINLKITSCNGLVSLPEGMESLINLYISSCNGLVSLPKGMEGLINLQISKCNGLTSFPEGLIKLHELRLDSCDGLVSPHVGMEGLSQLQILNIENCRRLRSLPEVLLLQLPNLDELGIIGHDELIRPFQSGGDYCHLIEKIPRRNIKQSVESPT